ncbi:MAG: MFS transporter [Acidimicrobiales bacterium]
MAHVLAVAGDTLVTMALAGSLFFSISPQAARGRVALYLLLTMAPFVVLAPLIGPVLDRRPQGRRAVLVATAASRAVVCLSMASHLGGLWLFPHAFAVLALSKAHMVTKSALVPATVARSEQLVGANSRLAVLSVVAGFAAALPGLILLKVDALGATWVVRLAALAFLAATVAGMRMRRPPAPSPDAAYRAGRGEAELHTMGVRAGALAMTVLRAVVGFLTFLLAFAFRSADAPSWWFGVVLGASMVGSFVGSAAAPRLRRRLAEERMLQGALVLVAVAAVLSARAGGLAPAVVMATVVGAAAGAAKLAFDSVVQRDAPDAIRGRTFARFETHFQLAWVLGAAVPVVLPVPQRAGMDLVALASTLTLFAYFGGVVAAAHRGRHFTSVGGEVDAGQP